MDVMKCCIVSLQKKKSEKINLTRDNKINSFSIHLSVLITQHIII